MTSLIFGSPYDRLSQAIVENNADVFPVALHDMHKALLPPEFLSLAVKYERHAFMPILLDRTLTTHRMMALGLALESHPNMADHILNHRLRTDVKLNNFFSLHEALAMAAGDGHTHAVKTLLRMGVNPEKEDGREQRNPLSMASSNGRLEMTLMLWPLITDPQWRNEALTLAAYCNEAAVTHALWDLAPEVHDTAIGAATQRGHDALGCALWRRLEPEFRTTPLANKVMKSAAKTGEADLVAELLTLVDPAYNDGTALRLAVEQGHPEVIRLLVPGTDPKTVRQVWTRQNPKRWDLVNQLLLYLPEDIQKDWLKQSPGKFSEAQAILRARRAAAATTGPSSRRRARP